MEFSTEYYQGILAERMKDNLQLKREYVAVLGKLIVSNAEVREAEVWVRMAEADEPHYPEPIPIGPQFTRHGEVEF